MWQFSKKFPSISKKIKNINHLDFGIGQKNPIHRIGLWLNGIVSNYGLDACTIGISTGGHRVVLAAISAILIIFFGIAFAAENEGTLLVNQAEALAITHVEIELVVNFLAVCKPEDAIG